VVLSYITHFFETDFSKLHTVVFHIVKLIFQLEKRSLAVIQTAEPLLETCSYRFLRESDLLKCLTENLPHPPTRDFILSLLCKTGRLARMVIGQSVLYKEGVFIWGNSPPRLSANIMWIEKGRNVED
jgi:hypothetical protein